ncbi:NAD(P)-dependent oxidoreductase [Roseicyclus sp. F158]|uniref:NAD(P)-dependent oxidoreductase n=1 Tax=Tropicimonas omnivorans TaxID=3075590 RepID=A0ABU3DLD4_9RHOB|nr:NAD(P)-dependent oxidoreductase [Roseicyclus sp. F158]MDT0683937.1 NAD(P)-dependent oxidoreductase [Roseicyclus sp. F158]
MRIAITGGTGLVGRFLTRAATNAGHDVILLGRTPPGKLFPEAQYMPWQLGQRPDLSGADALIHAAFRHEPGRYRGGEGDDPEGFSRANLDGTLRLWDAAERAGAHVAFLSTRAVYGDYAPGTRLTEDLPPRPDTLYGKVKLAAEEALGQGGASLRATGVYGPAGPGLEHKWTGLFRDFAAGTPISPRVATEVHGEDLAAAVLTCLNLRATGPLNVSDLVLDRRDLLGRVSELTGIDGPLPDEADRSRVSEADCSRLRDLGWRPGGWDRLEADLPELVRAAL